MRKIHIEDEAGVELWRYKIFKFGTVVIKSPMGIKYVYRAHEIFDVDPSDVERGYWKGWMQIKPSHIKNHIIKNIIGANNEQV